MPPEDLATSFASGLARVLAGDVKGYEELAQEMPGRMIEKEPHLRWHLLDVVRTCTLRPQGTADPAGILQLARRACEIERNNWNVHNLGVAHYRNGEFELARQRIEEARKIGDWYLFWPALAMTYHRLGRTDDTREWLNKAEEKFRDVTESGSERLKTLDEDPFWQDWAYFEAMLLEARALIDGDIKK